MSSGIYKITNLVNGKFYIGKSKDLEKRKKQHFTTLKKGNHINKNLQIDFNLYGEGKFTFEVLEYTENLDRQESIHCYNNDIWSKGYNKAKLLDYRVISKRDAIQLGSLILNRIFNKNKELFDNRKSHLEFSIDLISEKIKINSEKIIISFKEALDFCIENWYIRLEQYNSSLVFVNQKHLDRSIKALDL